MKKLFKLSAFSLMLAFLVTGCGMKEEFGIKVGKDKDVELEFLVAQDDEMIDAMIGMGDSFGSDTDSDEQKTYTDKERWEFLDSSEEEGDFEDFTKEKYDKNGYKGYTYTLKLGKIDDFIADGKDTVNIDEIGKDSKLFTKDGDTYKLNIKLSDTSTSEMEQYKGQVDFDVKVKVTLPNKAKSNNATKVDGKTYIWDLTKAKSIDLSFDLNGSSDSNNNTVLYVGIGVGVAAVIGVAYVVLNKKKKPTE